MNTEKALEEFKDAQRNYEHAVTEMEDMQVTLELAEGERDAELDTFIDTIKEGQAFLTPDGGAVLILQILPDMIQYAHRGEVIKDVFTSPKREIGKRLRVMITPEQFFLR